LTTEQTIFSQTPSEPSVVTPQPTALPPEVAEFVGQGKKYSTVDDAIKSVPHAQKHIQTLEQELAQVKADLAKRQTTEELLSELKTSGLSQGVPTDPPSISPEELSQRINDTVVKTLQQKEAQNIAQANAKQVTDVFISKFGDKAEEMFKKIAQESGLTVGNLNYLSATSPQAVLRLAGINSSKSEPMVTKTNSSVKTDGNLSSNFDTSNLSAKVKSGASTKDMVSAWKVAGQKVGRTY
jgi:hypothetical protein